MALTISAELVPPLRDGAHFDLAMQVEEVDALIEPHDRGDVSAGVGRCFDRANGTRALLDVTGWVEPEGGSRAIDIDPHEHHEALLRALHLRIGSERGVENDRLASADHRAAAKARGAQLADLARQVEAAESEVTVTVPAKFVNLLREVVMGKLADCAAEIEDSGHSHPADGVGDEELESFDTYRALLEQVGTMRTIPAMQLALDLRRLEHRRALVMALRERLEFAQYMMDVDRAHPDGAKQHRGARREARQIKAFMASAGLEGDGGGAAQEVERDG